MIKEIKFGKLITDLTRNKSRAGEDFNPMQKNTDFVELIQSIFDNGYYSSKPMIIRSIRTEEKDYFRELRKSEVERIAKMGDFSITSDTGKLKITNLQLVNVVLDEPTHVIVAGNYRWHATLVAIAGGSKVKDITCDVVEFKNDMDEFLACIKDNAIQSQGVIPLTDLDKLHSARLMYQLGQSESQFRNIFKAGTGQKLYQICRADKEFKDLGIFDSLVKGDLKFAPLNKEDLRKMLKPLDNVKADDRVKLIESLKPQVQVYFQKPKESGNASSIMKKPEIQKLGDQTPIELVTLVVQCILDDNTAPLAPYVLKAEEINKAIESVMAKK